MRKVLIILLCGGSTESFICPSPSALQPFHTSLSVALFAQEGDSSPSNDIGRNKPDWRKTGKRDLRRFDRSPASKDNSKRDATAEDTKGIRTRLFNLGKSDTKDSFNQESKKGKSVQVGQSKASIEDSGEDVSLIQRFRSFSLAKKKPKEDKEQSSKGKGTVGAIQTFFSGLLAERNEEKWVFACPKSRLSPGEIVPVDAAGLDLLIIASQDGRKLHCIANSCPHLGTPLEVGTLERRPVELKDTTSIRPGSSKSLTESDVTALLTDDGCEDCIVCPLHKTAFVLETGEVNGEWCPYPPVLGAMMGNVKKKTPVPIFEVRTRGKNVEVRITSSVSTSTPPQDSNESQDTYKV